MKDLLALAAELQDFLQSRGWRFCDWTYILKELEVLADLKEEPEIVERLLELRKSLEAGHR